jgi:protein-S-isoprenylcysteine O-methyltransferase Ste14
MQIRFMIIALWVAWALSWFLAAAWSNPTEKRAGFSKEIGYRLVQTAGVLMLFIPAHGYEGSLRLWHIGFPGALICIALIIVGFGFCWWARLHLGRLWSGNVTKKADHRVIDTGPYAWVRHPIYTGILLAALATAAAKGTVFGVAGASLMVVGLWMKARLEERWLSQELGDEAYGAYRRRVPMLVPGGPRAT